MEAFEITRRLIKNPAECRARANAMLNVLHESIDHYNQTDKRPPGLTLDAWLQQIETVQMLLEVADAPKHDSEVNFVTL